MKSWRSNAEIMAPWPIKEKCARVTFQIHKSRLTERDPKRNRPACLPTEATPGRSASSPGDIFIIETP